MRKYRKKNNIVYYWSSIDELLKNPNCYLNTHQTYFIHYDRVGIGSYFVSKYTGVLYGHSKYYPLFLERPYPWNVLEYGSVLPFPRTNNELRYMEMATYPSNRFLYLKEKDLDDCKPLIPILLFSGISFFLETEKNVYDILSMNPNT